MKQQPPLAATPRAIFFIMLAVLAWGGMLALGAYLYGGAHQGLKAALILGCVMAFLGLWAALLKSRKPPASDDPELSSNNPPCASAASKLR